MCPSLARLVCFARLACFALSVVAPLATVRPVLADIVYAVSFSTGELIRYDSADPAGTKTPLLAGGSLVSPASMTVGPDGNLSIGENGDGDTYAPRISMFEPATLTLSTVYPFAAFEVFPGSLASSPGLALAPDGRLYVSNQTSNFVSEIASGPVSRFDAAGAFVGELIADGADGLSGPTGLAITPDGGTLFTASIMTGTILQTDLATDATTAFASAGGSFEVGPLALLSTGGLLAGNPSGNGSIYRFDTDGTLISTFASGLGQIGGIATVAVPEPTTISLVAGGLLAAGSLLRRRRA